MKKLMIAAAMVGASSLFADVYNVKFTATTTVGASKKYKGVLTDYLKKGSVVVNGLYDSTTTKYYFWTGSGAKMVPVQKAIFETQNAIDMDAPINGKNIALNAGFYVGEDDALGTAFVAGGLGKVLTVGGDDMNSASGSFAGKYEGNPAYGTWAFSKNASATKKGIDAYINALSKKNLTVADWGDNSELKSKLDAWRDVAADAVANAEQVKKDLEEIANLKADLADKTLNVKELEDTKLMLENDIGRLEASLADKTLNVKELENTKLELENAYGALEKITNELKALNADQKAQLDGANAKLDLIDGAFKDLNDKEALGGLFNDYLTQTVGEQGQKIKDAKKEIDDMNAATNAYFHAANGGLKADLEADIAKGQDDMLNANKDLRASEAARDELKAKLAYKISITNGTFLTDNKAAQDAATKKIQELEQNIKANRALLDAYLAAVKQDQMDNAVDSLTSKTNELAKMVVAADKKLEDAKKNAEDAAKILADYTLDNGNGNYEKWLADTGNADTADNMVLFNAFYVALIDADKKAQKELKYASDESAQLQGDLKMTTAWLDEVIAAVKDGVLVGSWKNLTDDANKKFDEYEQGIIDGKIPELRKELEELKAAEAAAKAEDLSINAFDKVNKDIVDAETVVAEKAAALNAIELNVKDLEKELADIANKVQALETAFVAKYGFKPTEADKVDAFLVEWSEIFDLSVRNVEAAKDLLDYVSNLK